MTESGRQITAHITAAERAAFGTYARTFLLDVAGLLALLFAREMRVDRLRELIDRDTAPSDIRNSKVTLRLSEEARDAILEFIGPCCDSVSRAGAVIIRAELDERSLERLWLTRNESR